MTIFSSSSSSSSSSTASLATASRSAIYHLDETRLDELEQELKKPTALTYKRFELLIRGFSLDREHSYLRENPLLAARLSRFIIDTHLTKGISTKETIYKTIQQFHKHKVYLKAFGLLPAEETVRINCADGSVSINKELLAMTGNHFSSLLAQSDNICLREYHKASIAILKTALYIGKVQELARSEDFASIQTAVELIKLTHSADLQYPITKEKISTIYVKKLKALLQLYPIKTKQELEQILLLLATTPQSIPNVPSLKLIVIKEYKEKTLKIRSMPNNDAQMLPIELLHLLLAQPETAPIPSQESKEEKKDSRGKEEKREAPPITASSIITRDLLSTINGFYYSKTSDIGALLQLLYDYPEEVLHNMRYADIESADRNDLNGLGTILEAIGMACPLLKTLRITISGSMLEYTGLWCEYEDQPFIQQLAIIQKSPLSLDAIHVTSPSLNGVSSELISMPFTKSLLLQLNKTAPLHFGNRYRLKIDKDDPCFVEQYNRDLDRLKNDLLKTKGLALYEGIALTNNNPADGPIAKYIMFRLKSTPSASSCLINN